MRLTWCHNRLAVGSTSLESGAHVLSVEEIAELLARTRITHLVNLRRDSGHAKALEVLRGIVILYNPTEDDGLPKPAEWFGHSVDFVLHALANPRHKVCVCSYHGSNRSPSTALAVLMAQGLKVEVAKSLVLLGRPRAEMRYTLDAAAAVKELGYA